MHPRVGIAVFAFRGDKIILGKRKGSHGAGTWALPGGHLEFGETWEKCAAREVLEETGLELLGMEFLTITNDVMHAEGKHYITIFIRGSVVGNEEPRVREPEKCEEWKWVTWEEVKAMKEENEQQMFLPILNLFKQHPEFETYC